MEKNNKTNIESFKLNDERKMIIFFNKNIVSSYYSKKFKHPLYANMKIS